MVLVRHFNFFLLSGLLTLMLPLQTFASTSDYAKLGYIDQTLTIGAGLSYTKIEIYTEVGNYFLLSEANPRLDVRYAAKVEEKFRNTFHGYFVREQYIPENSSFFIHHTQPLNRFGLTYQPQWFSEGKGFCYGLNLQLKQANVVSEVPNTTSLVGDISQRISYETGLAIKWFGQTVSRLPMSLDLDFSYVNHLDVNSPDKDYASGYAYRIAFVFDFGRRSYFSNFNIRAFYDYEKIETSPYPMTTKELGVSIARSLSF